MALSPFLFSLLSLQSPIFFSTNNQPFISHLHAFRLLLLNLLLSRNQVQERSILPEMTDSDCGKGLGPGPGRSLSQSHSFEGYSSGTMAEIAARVVSEFEYEDEDYYGDDVVVEETVPENEVEHEGDDGGESDFEFEFVVPGGEDNSSPISAGEIFCNGQIKPVFPLFDTDLAFGDTDWRSNLNFEGENSSISPEHTEPAIESSNSSEMSPNRLPLKKLLLSERETSLTKSASCSSSEADDLEGANPATYCVWTPPKQEMSKKSKSTGSSKRWKLRNLVHRSHSDGREKFVFIPPKSQEEQHSDKSLATEKPEVSSSVAVERRKEKAPLNATVGKAHRDHYLRNRAMKESDRKKSYLPYKQDLVGFFANVNGLSRSIQPF